MATDEAALAVDAVREVGPGGHFFGTRHTQDRYKTAFFAPMISDWRNHEAWTAAGRPEALHRAHEIARTLLDSHEPPPMDPAAAEELTAFVAKRKEEGGAPTDF
jgi:trimethylamine--corrinoid protein Co-methyltransferase